MNIIEALDDMTRLVIKPTGASPIHNCLLCLNDTKKGFHYSGANGRSAESNTPINPTFRFKTGSITKPFTAVIVLQLMEEGALALTARFLDLVSDSTKALLKNLLMFEQTDHTNFITISHLLTHKSGLKDYFSADERFAMHIRKFPGQQWNWKLVMEKYFEYGLNHNASFPPGGGFRYADTNYLLLALLIEEVCNQPFHEVLEERILQPIGLKETYLEFHQPEKGSLPIVSPSHGRQLLNMVNTSFDWGGGGLVSNADDLNIFIRALVNGQLFKNESTLNQMLNVESITPGDQSAKGQVNYGLGLQVKTIAGLRFVGHNSAYGAVLFYEPINELSIVVSLNQMAGMHKLEWLLHKAVRRYLAVGKP